MQTSPHGETAAACSRYTCTCTPGCTILPLNMYACVEIWCVRSLANVVQYLHACHSTNIKTRYHTHLYITSTSLAASLSPSEVGQAERG